MEERNNNPKKGPARKRSWRLPVITAAAALALIAGGLTARAYLAKKKSQGTNEAAAPGFVLRDQQGRKTSLAQFRGKVVVLTFIDPECTQLCPLTTQSMLDALKILGPTAASQVQLLGVDANPLKTKVADVAAYTRTHEMQGRWRFVTGSPAQLKRVWRAYHVYVAVKNNDIEHTAIVYLIDRNGIERATFNTPMDYQAVGDQAEMLARGIAGILPGHPAVPPSSLVSQLSQAPLRANETIHATSLGPNHQTVALGSSHPHLVVFFAGWLGPEPELLQKLAALDRYAALARRHGWPAPVAIDELPTEPSPAEARRTLAPIAAKLHTPVVEDAGGRLAGAYHVGDLPWFVLNSGAGMILWRHDGWVSAAALNAGVKSAMAKH